MAEDFILLLESEREKIFEVLRPHFNLDVLKYFKGGFFDDQRKRFFGYAIAEVNTEFYSEYGYLFDDFKKGYSVNQSGITSEKTKIYLDSGAYQYKSIEERIEAGLYHHLLISFYGDFDFGEWNILHGYNFTDEKNSDVVFRNQLLGLKGPIKDWFFSDSIFQDTTKFFESMNYPDKEIEIPVSTNMKEFIGHSHLTALVRNERKVIVNTAYESYIKKVFFEPFAIKLKTHYPEKYYQMGSFWASDCDMMYPDHKQFCLMISFAIDKNEIAMLQCFVYRHDENRILEWTYFPAEPYEHYGAYSEAIVDIFKPISKCDHMDYIREPDCTLDDDDFWDNYVFKKEGGEYLYLNEITFDR